MCESMSGRNIRAVVFDLDGTLLDTLEDLAEATNVALRKNGLPERSTDEVRRFVGNGIANLIARALPGHREPETVEVLTEEERELHAKVLIDFSGYYEAHCEDKTKPYEGILSLLDELKERGLKIAVVSNKADFAVKKLMPAYFGDRIDVACGEDEAHGIRKKPAPEMVLRALETLGVRAEEAIYVGDSDVDIMTAANAGMPCVSVLWGFRSREFLLEHGAVMLIEKPEEVMASVCADGP